MKDMLGRDEAVSVSDALRLITENLSGGGKLPDETMAGIADSFGRVLARDVVSPEDLPGFSRSTVDGFAVRAEDTFGRHSYLSVSGEVQMAEEPGFALKRGDAVRISTGGMLPPGADSVVMLEHVGIIDEGTIEAHKPVAPGENIIKRGEDVNASSTVLLKGRRLRPQDVSLLAGLGIRDVPVYRQVGVSVISTGDEVVSHEEESPLRPGLIRDMNSFILSGLIQSEGGIVHKRGIFKDEYPAIRSAVELSLKDSSLILITGGSSVGARDLTAKVIKDMGSLLFHGVSMKPGKPLMAGFIDGRLVFGLPGHPAAVMVCFEVFVRPALRLLSGIKEDGLGPPRNTVKARLAKSVHSAPGKQEYIRVSLEVKAGEVLAAPVLGKSGLISTFVKADGIIIVPADKLGIEAGDEVEVRLFGG